MTILEKGYESIFENKPASTSGSISTSNAALAPRKTESKIAQVGSIEYNPQICNRCNIVLDDDMFYLLMGRCKQTARLAILNRKVLAGPCNHCWAPFENMRTTCSKDRCGKCKELVRKAWEERMELDKMDGEREEGFEMT
jgi:hypothetical protein